MIDAPKLLKIIAKACEDIIGVDASDIGFDNILGKSPEDGKCPDMHIGMDDVDMIRLMMTIESKINCELPDHDFLNRQKKLHSPNLWEMRTVRELTEFLLVEINA